MNPDCTLWMGDIEPWMDELFIMNSFKQYGIIPKSVRLIIDKRLNKSKNFCFINFNNFEEANLALFKLNSKQIPKTNLFFKLNITKFNSFKCKILYVGNLSKKINDLELFIFFKSKYPSVYYASIITDNGISRGYGFIHFSKEEEYKKCLKEMDGKIFHNKIIKVKEKTNKDDQLKDKNKNIDISNIIIICQRNKKEDENTKVFLDETNILKEENDNEQDISLLNSSKFRKINSFKENIDLLKSNNLGVLYKKIKESIDKMVDYYQKIKDNQQMSKIILYYYNKNYKK